MDIISVSALVIAIISALGHFIKESHIQKMKCCFCIESDCIERNRSKSSLTPPQTPREQHKKNFEEIKDFILETQI